MSHEYEKHFLYRLVKVCYAFFFSLSIFGAVFIAFASRPIQVVDHDKSTVDCHNGKKFNFTTAKLFVFLNDPDMEPEKDRELRKLCDDSPANTNLYDRVRNLAKINYSLNIVEMTSGSWRDAFIWAIVLIGVPYVVLNLIRETLNYLFVGKSFDWKWLRFVFHA